MKKAIALMLTCLFMHIFVYADWGDSVLLWQIDLTDTATIDNAPNTGVFTFLSERYDTEYGAMIVACDGNGNVVAPLISVADPDYPDVWLNKDEYPNSWHAIQSYMPTETFEEMIFQMQIGVYDDDFNFAAILYSDPESLEEISKHTYIIGGLGPSVTDWAPNKFYTVNPITPAVPEPSTSLLCMVGVAVLGLRRKRPDSM